MTCYLRPTTHYKLRTSNYALAATSYRVHVAYCVLPAMLPAACYGMIAHGQLPTIYDLIRPVWSQTLPRT